MESNRRFFITPLLIVLILLSSFNPVLGQQAVPHGLDPANMDLSVDPAEDFYRFVNGGWLDSTEIPGDEGRYGVFNALEARTRTQLLGLLNDAIASGSLEEGSDTWKAAELYRQGMDVETRNAQGITPIQPILDEIDAIEDMDDYERFQQTAIFSAFQSLFALGVSGDLMDSSVNSTYLEVGYLGLPNRDYYLDEDESTLAVQEAYIATNAELLGYIGYSEEDALASAQAVFDLEYSLASATMTREEEQEIERFYNPRTIDELATLYPLMDWDAYIAALGLSGVDTVIVTDVGYFEALPGIVADTPVDVLKTYSELELLWGSASYLSEDIEATAFAFAGGMLEGVTEQRPLEDRTLGEVNGAFGDAIGQLYVEAYFPPEAKEEITELVDLLIVSFGHRIDANPWMTPETKARAREKLDTMIVKVGYPDEWQTYEGAEVGDSYFATMQSVFDMSIREDLDQLGQPVDKSGWDEPPQTVNAYYNPTANEIVFPAGILQAPFFDYQADPALNFGGIGYVIGHEITHAFDLQGSQFDAQGNLSNWWTDADLAHFAELNEDLAAQYSSIEVLPGYHVNGQLTITENAADLGGLQVAYDALQIYLAESGQPQAQASPAATPVTSSRAAIDIENLTPQQKFFISAATVWRQNTRDETAIFLLRVDPHSPAEVRATLPSRNMDAFYEAFDIDPGDAMYLAPEDRIIIW